MDSIIKTIISTAKEHNVFRDRTYLSLYPSMLVLSNVNTKDGTTLYVITDMLTCKRCRHQWTLRGSKLPQYCAKCNSPYWNRDRVVGV
jgi:predicted Zn-ribbon and HTH transcriptional regulator